MKLFEPITIGRLTLRNRLVFAPYETNYATEEGLVTQRQIDHYQKIARGGTGLIVVEASNVNPDLSLRVTPFGLGVYDDKVIAPLQRLSQAIHGEGCKVILQLADKSILAKGITPGDFQVSEIEKLIDYFVKASVRVQKAGFDGVNFHMAHAYTLAHFLSIKSNKRTDAYGKGMEGKSKISVEILKRTRQQVGGDFLLVPRLSGDEFIVEGNTLKQTLVIAKILEETGADMLDISAGGRREETADPAGENSYSAHRSVPRDYLPDGVNVYLAEAIKKATQIPVITVGKIKTAALAEEILQNGKADLVAMGRQLFADPDFPKKVQEGMEKEIISCLSCRYCHRVYFKNEPIECVHRVKAARQQP